MWGIRGMSFSELGAWFSPVSLVSGILVRWFVLRRSSFRGMWGMLVAELSFRFYRGVV